MLHETANALAAAQAALQAERAARAKAEAELHGVHRFAGYQDYRYYISCESFSQVDLTRSFP